MRENSVLDDFLYKGLPCIQYKNKGIAVFSPCSLQVALIKDFKKIDKLKNRLKQFNFFSSSVNVGPMEHNHIDITMISTKSCNLRCKYCFVYGGIFNNRSSNVQTNINMPKELAIKKLDAILKKSPQKMCSVSFFGGEPTLNMPLIKHVVKFTRQNAKKFGKEFYYSITTNGVFPEKTLKYLLANSFSFTVSADGLPLVQDWQRPGLKNMPTSGLVEKTIRRIAKHNIPLKIRATVCDKFVGRMSDSVEYFSSLGAKVIHFEPITYAGRGADLKKSALKKPKKHVFAREFIKALRMAERKGCRLLHSSYMNFLSPAQIYCDAHTNNRFVLTPDGLTSRCLEIQDVNHELAAFGLDFDDGDSQKKHEQLLKRILNYKTEAKYDCLRCFAKFSCGGACPVRNIRETGKPEIVSLDTCWLTRALFKKLLFLIAEKTVRDSWVLDEGELYCIYQMRIPNSVWLKKLYSIPEAKIFSVAIDK